MLDQKKLDFEQIYAEYQPKIFRTLEKQHWADASLPNVVF